MKFAKAAPKFLGVLLTLLSCPRSWSQNATAYQAFFHEKVLLVSESRDGLYPNNLRSTLIQASALRGKDPFLQIKINFSPSLQKIEITKGPLPSLDGSWTKIDCRRTSSGVTLEYKPEDPETPGTLFELSSFNNQILGCRIQSPGNVITIRGNDNQILENYFIAPASSSKQRRDHSTAEIQIEENSNHNLIEKNIFEGGNANGILLKAGIGKNNRIFSNLFKNHLGQALKVFYNSAATNPPKLLRLTPQLDQWRLEGQSGPNCTIEIFAYDSENHHLGPLLGRAQTAQSTNFSIVFRGENLIPGKSQIAAFATVDQKNTSEMSEALTLPGLTANKPGPEPFIVEIPTRETEKPEKNPAISPTPSPNLGGEESAIQPVLKRPPLLPDDGANRDPGTDLPIEENPHELNPDSINPKPSDGNPTRDRDR